MLKTNPHSLTKFPICLDGFTLIERPSSGSHAILITKDLLGRWPLVGNLAMGMTILWIVNIWINTSLKHLMVKAWFGWCIPSGLGEMDIEEGGDVTQIEQTAIAKLDWF